MKDRDIGWIAALLEGEGHFRFAETPRIDITMTDRDVIEKAHVLMKVPNPIQIVNRGDYKTQYAFTVTGSLAAQWMMTLWPLMGERRKLQIEPALAKWKLQGPRGTNQNTNKTHCDRGHEFSEENTYVYNDGHRRICKKCDWLMRTQRKIDKLMESLSIIQQ